MSFTFGQKSMAILNTVKQPLHELAVVALSYSTVDFSVVQGNRTQDEQDRLYGQGRTQTQMKDMGLPASYAQPGVKKVTWTTHSNHIGGNAIDVCPFVEGSLQWDNDGSLGLWPPIVAAFKAASDKTGIPCYWGGDWKGGEKDHPHFSLVPG